LQLDTIGVRHLTDRELGDISSTYKTHLLDGLKRPSGSSSSLAMFDTRLSPVENLTPGKTALVVEFGGTNIRGSLVCTDSEGKVEIVKDYQNQPVYAQKEWSTRCFENREKFYDEAVVALKDLIATYKPDAISVIFSFPGSAAETENGSVDVSPDPLTKNFTVGGIETETVWNSFIQACQRNKIEIGDIPYAVLNDTPAVLLSGSAKIGGVVGTGFNLAVLIDDEQIFNTESGSFSGVPVTLLSEYIDRKSDKPGKGLAEKQISGMYLKESMKQIIAFLKSKYLLDDSISENIGDAFITDELTVNKTKEFMQSGIDSVSKAILETAAARLRYRSAQIVGAMIGTLADTFISGNGPIYVPIEGSVFKYIPGYKEIVEETASIYAGIDSEQQGQTRKVICEHIDHAGILGAAKASLALVK
jgi:hexokinase